jgi:iron complex transport system substrate-binding protein
LNCDRHKTGGVLGNLNAHAGHTGKLEVVRIVSLVPGATELVVALGAADQLVGISHECDYPASVQTLPRVTWTAIPPDADSATIDAQVRMLQAEGKPAIAVDARLLEQLRPTLILTQSLCEVCAVSGAQVHQLSNALPSMPQVLAMTGRSIDGVWHDIRSLGETIGREIAAEQLIATMKDRFLALRSRGDRLAQPPRVLCLEWLDPPFLAGHWVPELVEFAGGVNVGAQPGDHSYQYTWEELDRLQADFVIVALCGFDVARARLEIQRCAAASDWLQRRGCPVWLLDGNAYTSRAGPRLVEAAECIAAAIDRRQQAGMMLFETPQVTLG